MEAFAALGIACNILQLVSCGLEIASIGKQIYQKGSTDRNDEVYEHASQMMQITRSLDDRLKPLHDQGNLTKDQQELYNLAVSCTDISAKLQQEIDRLGYKSQKRRWRAIPATVKTMLHQKTIDDLEERLREFRGVLQTQLQANVYIQQEAMSIKQNRQYQDMDTNLQDLVTKIAAGSVKLSDLVLDVRLDLTQIVKLESLGVRNHIDLKMQSLQIDNARKQQQEKLEQSLQYPEMNERMSSLTEAHAETFEWLFTPGKQRIWSNFVDWLEVGNELYWISGKPGSGKSVLMKFLFSHSKTDDCLSTWAKGRPVVKIHFFIWKAGNKLQRTRKGLLASLLRQLVQTDDRFTTKVLDHHFAANKRDIGDWSIKELSESLKGLVEMQIVNVCIFIDGLDETDATDGDIGMLRLIGWLHALTNVKLCAASRAEPEFRTALAKCPQLSLQDLTADDLRRFACDQLLEVGHQQFSEVADESSMPQSLLELVLAKADGVFLWVRLAITNITRGFRRMDGWEELTRRLNQLPSELEDLYVDMWQRNRLDFDHYQLEAARYFRLVLEDLDRPVTSFDIMATFGDRAKALLENQGSYVDRAQLLHECKRLEQRVLSCSLGLLETRPSNVIWLDRLDRRIFEVVHVPNDDVAAELSLLGTQDIHFIHRTAVEFLHNTATGKQMLQHNTTMTTTRSQTELNALLLSPFCEFPIINGDGIRMLTSHVAEMEISDGEKIHHMKTFDKIQRLSFQKAGQDMSIDIYRNWIFSLYLGRWRSTSNQRPVKTNHGMLLSDCWGPVQYALGWRGLLHPLLLPYWEYLLVGTSGQPSDRVYVSCLAMSAACRDSPFNSTVHIAKLRLLNLMIARGADVDARFPMQFGKTPLIDPLSHCCCIRSLHSDEIPTQDELLSLLHELKLVLHKIKDHMKTAMRWLCFNPWTPRIWDDGYTIFSPEEHWDIPDDMCCLVELNRAAIFRMYCQCIGASELEIEQLLPDRTAPQCKLLGIQYPARLDDQDQDAAQSAEFRTPSLKTDSALFYTQLDKCSGFNSLLFELLAADIPRPAGEREARQELVEIIKDIHDRGVKANHEDVMISTGLISPVAITPLDIPFLEPFKKCDQDVSKLIYKD